MTRLTRKEPRQQGFVVNGELLFLGSLMIAIAVIGWSAAGTKVVGEMADLATAVGNLNQGYSTSGMAVFHPNTVHDANNPLAQWNGSAFADAPDFCDTAACDCGVVLCIAGGGKSAGGAGAGGGGDGGGGDDDDGGMDEE